MDLEQPEPPPPNAWVFRVLGFALVGIAAAGVVLPLLPTTPFLILAAACFARSSARWHAWLLSNPTFGPLIRDWETRRCIPRRAKLVSLVVMLGVGGSSILFAVSTQWARLAGLALVAVGTAVVLRIPTCPARTGQGGRER